MNNKCRFHETTQEPHPCNKMWETFGAAGSHEFAIAGTNIIYNAMKLGFVVCPFCETNLKSICPKIPYSSIPKLHITKGDDLLLPEGYYTLVFVDFPAIQENIGQQEIVYIRIPVGADKGYLEYCIVREEKERHDWQKWHGITMGDDQLNDLFIITTPVTSEEMKSKE